MSFKEHIQVSWVNDNRIKIEVDWDNLTPLQGHVTITRQLYESGVALYDREDEEFWAGGIDYVVYRQDMGNGVYYDDTALPGNTYRYTLLLGGPAGLVFGPTDSVRTTPLPPGTGGMSVNRTRDGNVLINFGRSSRYGGSFKYEVEYQADFAPWLPVGMFSVEDPVIFESPNPNSTYFFRGRAVDEKNNRVSGWRDIHSKWQYLYPLDNSWAPTTLRPNTAAALGPYALPVTYSWKHDFVDTSPQMDAELRWREGSGTAWSTVSGIGFDEFLTEGGGFEPSAMGWDHVEWQVRTKGLGPDWSDWSGTQVTPFSSKPKATLTAPAHNGVAPTSRVTAEWTYTVGTTGDTAQNQVILRLFDRVSGDLLGEWIRQGAATQYQIPYVLENGRSYRLGIWASNGDGISSDEHSVYFDADFPVPNTVKVHAEWERRTGSVQVSLEEVDTGDGVVDTVDIYSRSATGAVRLLAQRVGLGHTLEDPIPELGPVDYWAVSRTVMDLEIRGPITTADWKHYNCPTFLNGGPGYRVSRRMFGWESSEEAGTESGLIRFDGDEYPTMFVGEGLEHQVQFTGFLTTEDVDGYPSSTRRELLELIHMGGPVVLRTCAHGGSRGDKIFGAAALSIARSGPVEAVTVVVTRTNDEE